VSDDMTDKQTEHYNAINVKDDTYELFCAELRKLVIAKGGQFVTQDEAMKHILAKLQEVQ
jgi:hypothetical protein